MKINHLAIWTNDLERLREFYCANFNAISNKKYINPIKQFSSYFLTFENGGCSLELMNKPNLDSPDTLESTALTGLAHFSFSAGSKEQVDSFTSQLKGKGYKVIGEPRFTGDGFYESAIADPDGNIVEITI
ncbi:MAG TPA: VOC family protein [Prolixibacteraceae bacterium]|jgi:lactoylglutathione lyase